MDRQAALHQAEAEAEAQAPGGATDELAHIAPPAAIQVGSHTVSPMTGAHFAVLKAVVGNLADADLGDADFEALTMYVLCQADHAELWRLARAPRKFHEAAMDWVWSLSAPDYVALLTEGAAAWEQVHRLLASLGDEQGGQEGNV